MTYFIAFLFNKEKKKEFDCCATYAKVAVKANICNKPILV